ncbi:MAG: DUF2723 domain-containing protein, partial [Myxococcota bacterium]
AIAAAFAAFFMFRSIETTLRSLGISADRVVIPVALGGTWLVAGSYGWWFQAVRPEVYALQALLTFVVLERIIALEAAWPTQDIKPVYVAALSFGLALANHHFLAFLLLPALAPTLARIVRARGYRPVLGAFGFSLIGLSAYVLLPVRATAGTRMNLGDPVTIERFYWVLSAKVFQKDKGTELEQPMLERFFDVGVQMVDTLHWIPLLMGLVGLYALLRTPGARRIGTIWGVLLVVFIGARAWLGFVRSNPDALGYLMPAFGAVAASATAFVGVMLRFVAGADKRRPSRAAVVVALAAAALGLAQIYRNVDSSNLARFSATDAFDELDYRTLPPRAVVIAHNPQTVFRHWSRSTVEQLRPDVTLVPLPFSGYPGMANQLAGADPELGPLLRSYLLEDELRVSDLQDLAALRPVFVEMDPRLPQAAYFTLVPSGQFHQAMVNNAYADDRRPGQLSEAKSWQTMYRILGPESLRTETRAQLLWRSYMAAVFHAGVGDRDAALIAIQRGRAINADALELRQLEATVLSTPEDSTDPIDIGPFLP